MVGKVVYTLKLQASKGENNVNFTADQLTPGVYFYTISDGKNSVTRRMVVAAN
jgi:Uri superfamily endonuclease